MRARRQARHITGAMQQPDEGKVAQPHTLANNVGDALAEALVKASDQGRTDVDVAKTQPLVLNITPTDIEVLTRTLNAMRDLP